MVREDAGDEELVLAATLGDLEAFDELVRRYRPAVVTTARAIVGEAGAEDVAQEALLLAFKALPSLEEPARFASWLRVISRNRALRWRESEAARRRRRVELDEVLLEIVGGLQAEAAKDETSKELEVLLQKIPPDYAQSLRLRFFHEMPLKHIAAYLGVPLSTVKWRVFRGKALLRKELEGRRDRLAAARDQIFARDGSWNEKKSLPS